MYKWNAVADPPQPSPRATEVGAHAVVAVARPSRLGARRVSFSEPVEQCADGAGKSTAKLRVDVPSAEPVAMDMGTAYLCSLLAMDMAWLQEALYGPDQTASAPNTQPPSPSSSEGGSISEPTHILVPMTSLPTPRSEAGAQTTWETPSVNDASTEQQTDASDAGAHTSADTPSVNMPSTASTVQQPTDTLTPEAPSMDLQASEAAVQQQSNTVAFEAPAANALAQTTLPVHPPSPSGSEVGSISTPSYILVPVTPPWTPRCEAGVQTSSEAPPTASTAQQTITSDSGVQTPSEAACVDVRPEATTVEQQTDTLASEAASTDVQVSVSTVEQQTSTPQDWVHPWPGTTTSEAAADSEASSVADASEFDVWPAASMEALVNGAAVDVTLEAAEALMSPDSKASAYNASIPLSSHAVVLSEANPPFAASPRLGSRTAGSPSAAPPSPSRPSKPPTWAPSRDDSPSAAPPSQPPLEGKARDGEASSWMDAITTTAVMVATAAAVAVTTAAEAVGQRTSFGDEENQTEEGAKAIVYERTPSPRREPPRSPSAPAVSPGTPFSFFSPLYVPVAAATSSVMDAKQSAPGAAAMRESCSQQAPPTPVAAAMRQPSYVQEAPTTPSTPLMPPPPRPEPHFPEALPAQASSVLTALESLSDWAALSPLERLNVLNESAAEAEAAEAALSQLSEEYHYLSLPPTPRTASAFSVSPATSPPTSCRNSISTRPDVGAARLVSRKSERQNGLHLREKRHEAYPTRQEPNKCLSPESPHSHAPVTYATKKPWGASKSWDAWKAKSPSLDGVQWSPEGALPKLSAHRKTSVGSKPLPMSPRDHKHQEDRLKHKAQRISVKQTEAMRLQAHNADLRARLAKLKLDESQQRYLATLTPKSPDV